MVKFVYKPKARPAHAETAAAAAQGRVKGAIYDQKEQTRCDRTAC